MKQVSGVSCQGSGTRSQMSESRSQQQGRTQEGPTCASTANSHGISGSRPLRDTSGWSGGPGSPRGSSIVAQGNALGWPHAAFRRLKACLIVSGIVVAGPITATPLDDQIGARFLRFGSLDVGVFMADYAFQIVQTIAAGCALAELEPIDLA